MNPRENQKVCSGLAAPRHACHATSPSEARTRPVKLGSGVPGAICGAGGASRYEMTRSDAPSASIEGPYPGSIHKYSQEIPRDLHSYAHEDIHSERSICRGRIAALHAHHSPAHLCCRLPKQALLTAATSCDRLAQADIPYDKPHPIHILVT